jgi:hypothetical protein
MPSSDTTILVDGSMDWSGGVDSYRVTTAQSQRNSNGLPKNMLAWLVNGTTRGGVIEPRTGFNELGSLTPSPGLFQGGFMYKPNNAFPYIVFLMDGILYRVVDISLLSPNSPSALIVDLTGGNSALRMPPTEPHAYFVQGEQFLIVQAGDGVTLPLFWDGSILRRSVGLLGNASNPPLSVVLTNVDSVAGTVFPDQTGTNNPLGVAYTGFTAPAIGLPVTVTLATAYAGTVGSTVNLLQNATGQLQVHVGVVLSPYSTLFTNLSIPQGTLVPAQFAPGHTFGFGANFPAFTAPAIGASIAITFSEPLGFIGTTNTFVYQINNNFTVTTITNSLNEIQANVSELPAAYAMDYYMQRIWYAFGDRRTYTAGDIVGNTASGTPAYRFRDSILKVTENPLAIGGDGFSLPTDAGTITAISHSANINSVLGQGTLYVFTRKAVYALQVPVTRTDWIGANANNQPIQYAVQLGYGTTSDRSIVQVNGDLFYQTLQPSIQSLTAAVRNFTTWGDTPISVNEDRILAFNDRSLLGSASGIHFDNRLLQTATPVQSPYGVIHQSVLPMNFDAISTLATKLPPTWEGQYTGLNILQLFSGDYGGLERAFALIISNLDTSLQLWELTDSSKRDYGDRRITCISEHPAYTWSLEYDLKELLTCELWLDDVRGEVELTMEYRPDSDACWYPWHKWKVCSARNENETLSPLTPYPTQYGPGYQSTITLPHPPLQCNAATGRPAYIAYQIQPRLTIKGWCRVRSLFLHAVLRQRELYARNVCGSNTYSIGSSIQGLPPPRPLPPAPKPPPTPPTPPSPPVTATLVILADGAGGFWRVISDIAGNIGTQSDPGPQTPDVILDDSSGGFWKLIADTSGNRGAQAELGPATLPPVISDGFGGNWRLVVNPAGEVGAMSV